MDLYFKLFEVLFPVFFVIGIGYYLGKKNSKFNTDFITNFASKIGSPALIFYSLTSTGVTFSILTNYLLYVLLCISSFGLIGMLYLFFSKRDYIRELPPILLPNTGNIGLPICLFAYGPIGLGGGATFAAVVMLLHFTIGVLLASNKFDYKILIYNAPIYAIILSIILIYLEIDPPVFLVNTTMLISYTTIFLVLMSLGIALTKLKITSFSNSLSSSILRVIVGPIIGIIVIKYFNLDGMIAGIILIQSAMPSAILNYLIGSMYSPKKIVNSIASTIVLSTLISFITIPIIVFIALKYFI